MSPIRPGGDGRVPASADTNRDMRDRLRTAAYASLALLAGAPAAAAASIDDEIVVRHRAASGAAERAATRAEAGVALQRRLSLTGVDLVTVRAGSRAQALRELRADPAVLWAEPNYPVSVATNDQFWGLQYGLENLGGGGAAFDADADIPEAWEIGQGEGVTVGVVDTGVAAGHPDLAGQLVSGESYAADGISSPEDQHGHGTHVAGIIAAASGNEIGISGAAPLSKVKALRALSANGNGSTAAVAAAFDAAGDQGLRVVNASLGGVSASLAQREAIQAHPGTLFVVAAGNDGVDVDTPLGARYPCAYPEANVLCVGASDAADGAASFSNYGATSVDLFAAGDVIASTHLGGSYVYLSGTSMAAPLVAAAASILAGAEPSWTPAQIKAALLASVDPVEAFSSLSVTGGRLNAASAAAATLDAPADPPPPADPPTPQPELDAPSPGETPPEAGAPAPGEPATETPAPAPAPPLTPAPIVPPAPGSPDPPIDPSAASITGLRVTKARGTAVTLRISVSRTAQVKLVAVRRASGRRPKLIRRRTLIVPASGAPVALRGALSPLRLSAGTWQIRASTGASRRTLTVRTR